MDSTAKRRQELEQELNAKQQIFCHEYIVDWNASRAVRDAGYSPKGANVAGAKLLMKANIQEYIEIIKEDVAKAVGISKIGLLKDLKVLATSNIADFYTDWIKREDFEALKKDNPQILAAIQEISTKTEVKNMNDELIEVEYVKIKLYDKRLAIQDIFKAMGWNAPDKVDVTTRAEQPLFGDDSNE